MDQLVGNTVVVAIQLDVVIDIDLGRFPLCKDEPMSWERLEGGFVQGFKEALTGPLEFFEGAVIEKL
jgi:hypothetical protein